MTTFWPKKRELKALQVEVTSRCSRKCALCPRSALSDRWREGDLTNALWRRIEPALPRAEHVHLQGWGEPLLHPDLPTMARAAKKSGASVGITTNGDLLDSAMDWIIDEGVDLLTVSVAGNNESHPGYRDGSQLDKVMNSIRKLASRSRNKRNRTKVQISYLLTMHNAAQLADTVEIASNAKVHEVFVVHLDVTPTKDLFDQAAFNQDGLQPGIEGHLDNAERIARQHRIRFRGPPLSSEEMLACALNPARFVFVTWDGRVGPCVNLLLPIRGAIPRWDHDGRREVDPVSYGSLQDADLAEILSTPECTSFTTPFTRRLEAERIFLSSVYSSPGMDTIRQLEEADRKRNAALYSSPFPDECTGCHKKMGW